jgi:hypothetical protein
MFGLTTHQWWMVTVSGAIGFVALYFWLDYGFWASLGIEVVLVAVTVGMHVWRTSREAPPS